MGDGRIFGINNKVIPSFNYSQPPVIIKCKDEKKE